MKETKVYLDELPKCIFCPMLVNLSNIGESKELMCCLNRTAYCNDYSDIEKIERNFKLACPLKSLKTHDREKDKRIKELEQKVQELQEIDNKRAFRLYCMLYDMLEEKDPENVASRIDYLTGKDYSEMCELYKTAKNLKQHDRELVKEVLEKVKNEAYKDGFYDEDGNKIITYHINNYILDQIQKEFEK